MFLQNKKMLLHLKSIDGHAMHNVLKCRQSLIDGTNSLATPFTSNFILGICSSISPTSISMDLDPPLVGHVVNSSPSSTSTPFLANKGKIKGEYLQQQSRNIKHMASTMEVDSKQCLALM